MNEYYVYILASPSRTLYIGITNDLERRVWEHKNKVHPGFTCKYGVNRLVHVEAFAQVGDAIAREKELKGWKRIRKIALIEETNSKWYALSHGWYEG